MPRRIITEEELREAAREVLEYELAIFDSSNDYPDHIFHGKFRLDMAALLHEVKRGAVKAAKYSMGFTFYAKQCIAAVLILFTLSCIAMPETVLAGYHKLIEVIETVFEYYTEYRYRVNDDGGIEETFKPLKLGYLPEGMEEVWREENENSIDLLYKNDKDKYINIHQKSYMLQKSLFENNSKVIIGDSDNENTKNVEINGEKVMLNFDINILRFIWLHDDYVISGHTNLNEEELNIILEKMKLE